MPPTVAHKGAELSPSLTQTQCDSLYVSADNCVYDLRTTAGRTAAHINLGSKADLIAAESLTLLVRADALPTIDHIAAGIVDGGRKRSTIREMGMANMHVSEQRALVTVIHNLLPDGHHTTPSDKPRRNLILVSDASVKPRCKPTTSMAAPTRATSARSRWQATADERAREATTMFSSSIPLLLWLLREGKWQLHRATGSYHTAMCTALARKANGKTLGPNTNISRLVALDLPESSKPTMFDLRTSVWMSTTNTDDDTQLLSSPSELHNIEGFVRTQLAALHEVMHSAPLRELKRMKRYKELSSDIASLASDAFSGKLQANDLRQ
jgi:hypothetical protein